MATGGAERFLQRLVSMDDSNIRHRVISLSGVNSEVAVSIRNSGISVMECNITSIAGFFAAIRLLRNVCQKESQSIVHSWLYKANLFTTIALVGIRVPHAWNIRQSNITFKYNKWSTVLIVYILSFLSKFRRNVDEIVYCAQLSRQSHEHAGFTKARGYVIPNGIDISEFSNHIKEKLELSSPQNSSEPIVINVGRYDIQKGHSDFLRCAAKIKQVIPHVRFQLIGRDVTPSNRELVGQIKHLDLENEVSLLGEKTNVGAYLSRSHVFLSCSAGEGWPNALAEAMLVGLPVVHTDVGDSTMISGTSGYSAKVGDIDAMAQSVVNVLTMSDSRYKALSSQMTLRIQQEFPLEKSVSRYIELYRRLIGGGC